MSELALQYYDERSKRFNIATPPQLQGGQINLLQPDTIISVHGSPDAIDLAADVYAETIEVAGRYIWQILQSSLDDEQRARSGFARGLRSSVTSVLTGKLMPSKQILRTGKLSDIKIEAVARPELDPELIERARKGLKVTHEVDEDTEVYFVTSADLKSGTRKLGRCAALTVVGYYREECAYRDLTSFSTQMMHAAFPDNNAIARSGLSASRTTRTILDAFAAQNPLINNVGRGKR